MSAIIAVKYDACELSRYAGSVRMLTDAAVCGPDHVLTGLISKVWSSRKLPLAVSGRGRAKVVELVATSIVRAADVAPSVDDMLEIIIPEFLESLKQREVARFSLVICAWSESRGPEVYSVHPDSSGAAYSVAPYTLMRQSEVWAAAEVKYHEMGSFVRCAVGHPDFLERHGADLMTLVRNKPGTVDSENPSRIVVGTDGGYCVGGFCELTTVTADGVKTVRLRDWPEDKIGQKISPRPLQDLSKLNRHERRAAARRAA